MRTALNAAIIQDRKLLLVKKKETWILPGGKPEAGENDLECLSREITEELSGTKLCNIKYYGSFEGQTPHKKDILIAKVYLADIEGRLNPVRKSDSISEASWIDDFSKYNLSDITSKIINSLKEKRYL